MTTRNEYSGGAAFRERPRPGRLTATGHAGLNVAGALGVVAVGAAGYAAINTAFTYGHRAIAAAASALLVASFAVLVHVSVLRLQDRSGETLYPVAADADLESDRAHKGLPGITLRRRGIKAFLVGVDGHVSTSKTQVMLWTGALLAALIDLLLLSRSVPGGSAFMNALTGGWHPEYLALLGLPAATATVAKATVSGSNQGLGPVTPEEASRTAESIVARAVQDEPSLGSIAVNSPVAAALLSGVPRVYTKPGLDVRRTGFLIGFAELFTDDNDEVSWPNVQYVAFNALALIFFLARVLVDPAGGLPDIPSALILLMGASSATYMANKVTQTRGSTPQLGGLTKSSNRLDLA
jgi:hypothetical protein